MVDEGDSPHWHVKSRQRTRARAFRTALTKAEQVLWFELRAHRLQGLSFRRQHPIGPFIVDFVCLPCRIIVELDGGQHYEASGTSNDQRRDRFLAERGFEIVRFSNLDVLQNLTGVLETILATTLARQPPPTPPPQAGEGF